MGRIKIFVSGNGILGTALCSELAKKYRVTNGYHSNLINITGGDLQYAKIDICDARSLKQLEDIIPDVIIHTAALTDVEACEKNPQLAHQVNVIGTGNLLSYARKFKSKFIYISSDYIFDGEKGDYSEQDRSNPLNVYGRTKLEAEEKILEYGGSLSIRTTFFGWHPDKSKWHFSSWIIDSLAENKKIFVNHDQKNSIMFSKDLAAIVGQMLNAGLSGVYNIAGRDSLSIYDIALEFSKVFNLDRRLIEPVSLNYIGEKFGLMARRPRDTSLNVCKIETALEKKMPSIKQGILSMKQSGLYDNLIEK